MSRARGVAPLIFPTWFRDLIRFNLWKYVVFVAFSWPSQISQARNLFLAGKEISLSTPMTDWRFHGIAEFTMRNERISYPNFLLFL